MFKLLLNGSWLKKTVERQCKSKKKHHLFIIMTLSPTQQAALRAKKAIANGNTNFKPRGEKNKTAFEALKKQALTTQTTTTNIVSAESPPPKRMKITLDNYFRRQQALTTQTTTTNIVSAESPPQKRMKITGGSSHTSDLASLLDINLSKTSDNTINIRIHIFETPLVN